MPAICGVRIIYSRNSFGKFNSGFFLSGGSLANTSTAAPFISSFCYQFDGIFVGASQTRELRNAMIISVSIYIISAINLTSIFGNLGLWISFGIFFIVRGLTLFLYLDRIYKKIQ